MSDTTKIYSKSPQELLIATHNPAKIIEYKKLFSHSKINLLFAPDLQVPEPIENGNSFANNAIIKAQNATKYTGKIALGEDSGLIIDSLNEFPGINSARWAKEVGGYEKAFENLAKKLIGKSPSSSFHATIAISYPNISKPLIFTGDLSGKITFPPKGNNGFGYAPIFTADGHSLSLAEISNEERIALNHRAICITKLLKFWNLS